MVSINELWLSMMRSRFDMKTMEGAFKLAGKHANKEGKLDWDAYMRMIDEFSKDEAMMKEVHGGDDMMRDGGMGGGRMEMNMETLPDGTERMTIVM
jgi:hypothetical protein